ncbi:rCG45033 [Rattus norvegicus]|uniref:RCG45033 n=1 Tax=Rattus norvegicus TaxID=10116 RepID=A6KQV1_RAT|nr:rCG45033 [Rattus norvegicus]
MVRAGEGKCSTPCSTPEQFEASIGYMGPFRTVQMPSNIDTGTSLSYRQHSVTSPASLLFPGLLAHGYDPTSQGTVSLVSVSQGCWYSCCWLCASSPMSKYAITTLALQLLIEPQDQPLSQLPVSPTSPHLTVDMYFPPPSGSVPLLLDSPRHGWLSGDHQPECGPPSRCGPHPPL